MGTKFEVSMIKDIVPMFYTPLYFFHMENHEEYKQEVLEFVRLRHAAEAVGGLEK